MNKRGSEDPRVHTEVYLMPKSEYLCLRIEYTATRDARVAGRKVKDVYETEEVLNALGAHGWELVSYHPGGSQNTFVLKRPRA
jgi:hypothetical protein